MTGAFPFPVMLFAAGFGTRMGALTRDRPKPMVEVAGRPLIDHAIDLCRAAGATRLVANVHYKPDAIIPHLRSRDVAVSHETPEILDTGGGLRHALPLLGDGPVVTLNTDAVWTGPNPLTALAQAWRPGMGALLMTVPRSRTHGRDGAGDFGMSDDGALSRGGDLVFTGAQIIDPAVLGDYPDAVFSLSQVWTDLAARGALHGIEHPGHWADVGHPKGITAAEALLSDV